ncbi:MAG: L,D-transpeptidase family protein [Myxococcales bacterium]|nr:L,D-transpeptidase family protein [Myxococcales bacterium]
MPRWARGALRVGIPGLVGLALAVALGASGRASEPTNEDAARARRALAAGLPEFEFAPVLGPDWNTPVVDLVRVYKGARRLVLLAADEEVASYPIALGRDPVGHKQERGDGRTPEGLYVIDWRMEASAYHRSLHISYPNDDDLQRASERGVDPGGAIMIHGLPNGRGRIGKAHLLVDWTDGCIAVTNAEIEEIWRLVADGVAIEIRP